MMPIFRSCIRCGGKYPRNEYEDWDNPVCQECLQAESDAEWEKEIENDQATNETND